MDINRDVQIDELKAKFIHDEMNEFFNKYIPKDANTITINKLCQIIIAQFWTDNNVPINDQRPQNYIVSSSIFGVACETLNMLDQESINYISHRGGVICMVAHNKDNIMAITFRNVLKVMNQLM
jgi:hypothetical protein